MPTNPQAPEILRIPVAQFDASVLPAGARNPGTDTFDNAVLMHFATKYAAKGREAAVTVEDGIIRVLAWDRGGPDPKAYVVGLLQHGALEEALPLLETLDEMVADADIAFNHGLCLSELGRLEDCIGPLEHCVDIDPSYVNALVALGVANARLGRPDEAERVLAQALNLEPDNPFAARNLAGVLGNRGKYARALPLFRRLAAAQPEDPTLRLALANCLEGLGAEHQAEASELYREIKTAFPNSELENAAVAGLNRVAGDHLHRAVDDKPRADAVMYMQGAMERFAELPQPEVARIVMEIAQLGQSGLAINDPSRRYRLDTLAGDFSGLQLLSMMHVGMRLFDPDADLQTGLDREYALAAGLCGQSQP